MASATARGATFRHWLTRQVAYETQLGRDRAGLHSVIGAVLCPAATATAAELATELAVERRVARPEARAAAVHLDRAGDRQGSALRWLEAAYDGLAHDRFADAQDCARAAAAGFRAGADSIARAAARLAEAVGAARMGDLASADRAVREASAEAELATASGRRLRVRIHVESAAVQQRASRYDEAESDAGRALSADGGDAPPWLRAAALRILASVARARGEMPRARALAEQAIRLCRTADDASGEASGLLALGHAAVAAGELDAADALYREARGRIETMHDVSARIAVLQAIAVVARTRGDHDAALALNLQALDLAETIGDLAAVVMSWNRLGDLAHREGRSDEALRRFEEVRRLCGASGNRHGEAMALVNIGITLHGMERPAEGLERLRAAREITSRIGAHDMDAHLHAGSALCLLDLGRGGEAEGEAGAALAIARRSGNVEGELSARLVLAQCRRDAPEAARASDEASRLGMPLEEAEAARVAATILLDSGNHAAARGFLDRGEAAARRGRATATLAALAILRRRAGVEADGGGIRRTSLRIRFHHWLPRTVAYEALLAPSREALHARIADALLGTAGDPEQAAMRTELLLRPERAGEGVAAAEAASHFERAGLRSRAAVLQLAAAHDSDRRDDYAGAIRSAVVAGAAFRTLGDPLGAAAADSLALRVRSRQRVGTVAPDEFEAVLVPMAALTTPEADAIRARTLAAAAVAAWRRGDLARARRTFDEASGLAERAGVPSLLAGVDRTRGSLLVFVGETAAGAALLRRAVESLLREGLRSQAGAALNNLAAIPFRNGDLEEAETLLRRALALHRSEGDRHGEAVCLDNLASIASERGRAEDAVALHRDSVALHREIGALSGVAQSLSNLAGAYLRRGDRPAALEAAREGAETAERAGDRNAELSCRTREAEVHLDSGDPRSAIACAGAAAVVAERLGLTPLLAELCLIRGRALEETGAGTEARADADRALALARAAGLPSVAAAAEVLTSRLGNRGH